jgi:hypothetical protein
MNDKTAWPALDLLSPPARAAADANPGAAYTRLVVRGDGWPPARAMLAALRPESLLKTPARNGGDADALLAGLWLWHDWLDESHTLSQNIHTDTGSFWHAIMHRREGDFSNARYWYARCRHHPALAEIAAAGRAVVGAAGGHGDLERLVRDEWDPSSFVDVVQAVHDNPNDPLYPVAVVLQQAEWKGLFTHCLRKATGG